jgi:hypothetical protein
MSLIRCAACNAAISSKAEKCPKCGSLSASGHSISFDCSECGASLPFEHTGPCPECGNPEPEPSILLIEEPPLQPQTIGKSPKAGRPRESASNQSASPSRPASSKTPVHDVPDPVVAHRQAEAQKIQRRLYDLGNKLDARKDLGKARNIFSAFTEGLGCVFSFTTLFVFLGLMYIARNSETGSQVVIGLFVLFVVIALVVAPILEAANVRRQAREKRDLEVELKLLTEQLAEIEATLDLSGTKVR